MAERPPFDPARIRCPEPGPGPAVLSVRQVNDLIRGALALHLPPTMHVLGEIGNLSRPTSGHLYFTLKDATSELRCVMWRSAAHSVRFTPEVGLQVIATGGIEVYAQRGSYQLMVRKLEPRGVGALELAFRQLKERLEREGLFDAGRKRPLPRIPERIAIVTSPTGAALRDILHTLARRFPALDILVFPVRVQGDGAAAEIATAIRLLNEHAADLGGIDVLLVGRGGGSLEDLWAFNEEAVARAIVASRIPVVSAVGHEVDVSISDLVADLRAPTPTAAAELITPLLSELVEGLQTRVQRASRSAVQRLQLARAMLERIRAGRALAHPADMIQRRGQLLDEFEQGLRAGTSDRFAHARARLDASELALWRFGTGARLAHAGRVLEERLRGLVRALGVHGVRAERRFAAHATRMDQASPGRRLAALAERIWQSRERIRAAVQSTVVHRRQLLEHRLQAVAACDPRSILGRGFSLTRDARTRKLVRSVDQVREGLRIITEVADGEFRATADDPRQPSLFD